MVDKSKVYKELMKYKSFRESTPKTREEKLNRAIRRRKNKNDTEPYFPLAIPTFKDVYGAKYTDFKESWKKRKR